MARFAPKTGNLCAIVDVEGLHFVDTKTGLQTMMLANPGYVALEWSPAETFVVAVEKFNMQKPENNLHVIRVATGDIVASFEWRKTPKEGPKTFKFMPDESYCMRLAPLNMNLKEPNFIEVYTNCEFDKPPSMIIHAKFPVKPAKKSDPITYVSGKFDGMDLCPLDPTVAPEESPFYVLAWQNAATQVEEEENGTVYFYDISQGMVDRSKFMIQCPRGQEIKPLVSPEGYAALIWSQNLYDTTGKSYYGEHTLQYAQIFGGRERQFVPVFDNQIHDAAWVRDSQNFIVLAGRQPAVATLYDKNCTALFEFGKRFRNTIRICPFSQLAMIGGFGNLPGEMDFWDLKNLKQIGKAKSHCAVAQEWAPNGTTLVTSVLYERVRVDNMITLFHADGTKLMEEPYHIDELYYCSVMPREKGTYKQPSIKDFKCTEVKQEAKKPKRTFAYGGGSNSAFAQAMRQEMGKTLDKGSKKLDQNDRKNYKEFGNEQAKAAPIMQTKAQDSKDSGTGKSSNQPQKAQKAAFGNWRTGDFSQPEPEPEQQQSSSELTGTQYYDQQYSQQQYYEEPQQNRGQPQHNNVSMNQLNIEQPPKSRKNRRGKKKMMLVQQNPQNEEGHEQ